MKLTDSVYIVGSGKLGVSSSNDHDCNVYLIDGVDELALVDAGAGVHPQAIVENLITDGVPLDRLRYLLLTHAHWDHAGGSAYLQQRFNLEVMAAHDIADVIRNGNENAISLPAVRELGHLPSGYRFQPCPIHRKLHDGETVQIGQQMLTVIETPGHSRGCISFLMEEGKKVCLFCGDSIFHGGKLALQNIPDCDLHTSLGTIRRLGELSIDVLLPGHLCFALNNGQQHIDAALQVMAALGIPPNI